MTINYYFPLHTIALRNSLPPRVQNCQSLHSFKQTVFCHTFNTPPYTEHLIFKSSISVHHQAT